MFSRETHQSVSPLEQELRVNFGDSQSRLPGTDAFEARVREAKFELQQLFNRVKNEPNFKQLLTQNDTKVLHVCAGYGAVTEALAEILASWGIGTAHLTNIDIDPIASQAHEQAELPGQFITTELSDYLAELKAEPPDIIIGLLTSGSVVTSVAEYLERLAKKERQWRPYPYALLTTESPKASKEPNRFFLDYVIVQEWVNNHPTSPTWISKQTTGYSNYTIDVSYVLGLDPATSLERDQQVSDMNQYINLMED